MSSPVHGVVYGVVFALALSLITPSHVAANPTGEAVAAGSATIVRNGPGSLTVNQATDKVIINWNSFSIGAGEVTRFVQPGAHAAALNRVLGGNPSTIYGLLEANGRVYVINPNGILVGAGGIVNTHSFIGSTLDVTDADFLSGVALRFSGDSTATVRNEGTISAIGGDIFLFAHKVENAGSLIAQGTVGLGAGSEILLRHEGQERISVLAGNVAGPQTATGVDNVGAVQAASAELKAAGGNIYALAINNGGIVRADSIVNEGGRIFLRANGGNIKNTGTLAASGPDGNGGSIVVDGGHNALTPATVLSSGTIDAHGTSGKGGDVKILGDHVGLIGDARVNVSGGSGGGSALIGGDYRGENPDVQNAEATFISSGTRINANATANGDGGKVVVWADGVTSFHGTIAARGGQNGGNGGFVETSGYEGLHVIGGRVDAGSLLGNGGLWLLDPQNVTISGAATSGGTFDGGDPNIFTPTAAAIVNVTAIEDALDVGTDVRITTGNTGNANDGTITVAANITKSGADAATLELVAAVNININDDVTIGSTDGELNVILTADSDGANGGDINFGDTAIINTAGGSVTMSGITLTMDQDSAINTAGGDVAMTLELMALNNSSAINAGSGDVSITAGGDNNIALGEAVSGSLNISGDELQNFTTSGELRLVTTGAGAIVVENISAANSQPITGPVVLESATTVSLPANPGPANSVTFNSVEILANNGITLSRNLTTDSGAMTLNADADDDGTGNLTVNAVVANSSGNAMNITAADIILNPPAAGANLASSAGQMTITASDGRNVVLGGAGPDTAGTLTLTGTELQEILVSAAGGLRVITTGAGTITVNAVSAANSANIDGTLQLDSPNAVTFAAATTFDGAVNVASASAVNLNANVTTSDADQTYNAPVVLAPAVAGTDFTLDAGSGTVRFNSTVNGTTAQQEGLTVTGNAVFGNGAGDFVGNTVELEFVSVSGTTVFNAGSASDTVNTSGDQTYAGAVTLGADTVLNGANIRFNGTVNGTAAGTESLSIEGNAFFGNGGADFVGNLFALEALSVDGTTAIDIAAAGGNSIRTVGAQVYTLAVTMALDTTLNAGSVTFNSTVSAPGRIVTLTADNVAINNTVTANRVNIAPRTAGRGIELGVGDVARLSLSATEIGFINAPTLKIGDAASGAITITDAITPSIGTTTLSLQSGAGISQGGATSLNVANLALRAGGNVALNGLNNVDNVAADLTTAGSSLEFIDNAGLTVASGIDGLSGVTANNGNVQLLTFGTLTVNANVNAGAASGIANLFAFGLVINEDVIGRSGINLVGDSIAIDPTAVINAGSGVAWIRPNTDGTIIDLGGADAFNTLGLTDAELDRITAGVVRIGSSVSGPIFLTAPISAPGTWNTLALRTGGQIFQNFGDVLVVPNLAIDAHGPINLVGDVDNISGNVFQAGNEFNFEDTDGLTIATVDGIAGITTAGGNVQIITGQQLVIGDGGGQDITAPGGTVSLTANAGGVTEGAGSGVFATSLGLRGSGNFILNGGNNVTFLAGNVNGAVSYTDLDGVSVDLVNDNFGLINGLVSGNNAITLTADLLNINRQLNSGTARTILQPRTDGRVIDLGSKVAGRLGLNSTDLGNVNSSTLQIGNNTAGNIIVSALTLVSSPTLSLINNGSISGPGLLLGNALSISSPGPVDLFGEILTVAAQVTGPNQSFTFADNSGFTVGTVDGISGISTVNGNINLSSVFGQLILEQNLSAGSANVQLGANGGVDQTGGVITAARLGLTPGGGIYDLAQANDVDVLAANINGALIFNDIDGFSIGTVGINSGIENQLNNVTLTAGGAITQTERIAADLLTVKTLSDTPAGITLGHAANNVASVDLRVRNAADNANVAADIFFRDQNGFNVFAAHTGGDVTLIGGGLINGSGTVVASLLTALTLSDPGANIVFNNANNEVASIDLRARNAADSANAAGSIQFRDATGFNVNAARSSSSVELTGGGDINGPGSIESGALIVKTLNNAGASINLVNPANDATSVQLRTRNSADSANVAASIDYRDVNGVNIGALQTAGDVNIVAGGNIGQTGGIEVGGQGTFKTLNDGGAQIILDRAGNIVDNSFGSVSALVRNAADTANANGIVVINENDGATVLDDIQTAGNLIVNSTDDITQSGAAIVGGTATFNTLTFNDVILNANNNFNSVYVPNGNNITIRDVAGGFNIGNVRAFDTLNLVTLNGDIVQILAPATAVEASTLIGDVDGRLILGNPGTPAAQPANRFAMLGPLTHDGLYLYDFDNSTYGAAGIANPVPANADARVGLRVVGPVIGTGETIIRTRGDLVMEDFVRTTGANNDIILSAEQGANFHNLVGANVIQKDGGSRFLVYSTESARNFKSAIIGGKLTFNNLAADFLADFPSPTFENTPPITKQNGALDNGTEDGFVFLEKQSFVQQNESAKFFLDLLSLTVFSGVDATAKADTLPRDRPGVIWTSSYHIFLLEKQEEEERRRRKPTVAQAGPMSLFAAGQ